MPAPSTQTSNVTLTFTAQELAQIKAIATLHGTTVAAFIQKAALEAANITTQKKSAVKVKDPDALWLTDGFADGPEAKEGQALDLFAPIEAPVEAVKTPVVAPRQTNSGAVPQPKRTVAGEPSTLAKGHGIVWEIRQALGRERVHGLGWTREQLAFVLKLSVVGVRKMEHLGTTPIKSLEARKALLNLAKTLKNPSPEIAAYIETEEAALG